MHNNLLCISQFSPKFIKMQIIETLAVILILQQLVIPIESKKFEKARILAGTGARIESLQTGCEFECDRHCSLNPSCVATSFSNSGECTSIFDGPVILEEDTQSVAKVKGYLISCAFASMR